MIKLSYYKVSSYQVPNAVDLKMFEVIEEALNLTRKTFELLAEQFDLGGDLTSDLARYSLLPLLAL